MGDIAKRSTRVALTRLMIAAPVLAAAITYRLAGIANEALWSGQSPAIDRIMNQGLLPGATVLLLGIAGSVYGAGRSNWRMVFSSLWAMLGGLASLVWYIFATF